MINNHIREVLLGFSDNLGRVVGVIDEGTIYGYPQPTRLEKFVDDLEEMYDEENVAYTAMGYTFVGQGFRGRPNFVVFIEGIDDFSEKMAKVICCAVANIKEIYDEKHDKESFIKKLLLDHILPGDITQKTKELHLNSESHRAVFLIRTETVGDFSGVDVVRGLFPERNKDFIINIDDRDVVLVKQFKTDAVDDELESTARTIVDTINSEALLKVFVGVGTVVQGIKEIARSYKEAVVALEVGQVFDTEKYIVSYDNLGIGRLIYQLPTTLCELFLSEVFKKESLDVLDNETIITIQTFFENNLNVSETSRQLYVHRNTLVYRLDKVQKLTGLDLRVFDHAIVFKVAMMVKKYLKINNYRL